jgi:hypothetical protein
VGETESSKRRFFELTGDVMVSVGVKRLDAGLLKAVVAQHLVDAFDVLLVVRPAGLTVPAPGHKDSLVVNSIIRWMLNG